MPFSCAFTWALFAIMNRCSPITIGLLVGTAMSIRLHGLVLLVFWGIFVSLRPIQRWGRSFDLPSPVTWVGYVCPVTAAYMHSWPALFVICAGLFSIRVLMVTPLETVKMYDLTNSQYLLQFAGGTFLAFGIAFCFWPFLHTANPAKELQIALFNKLFSDHANAHVLFDGAWQPSNQLPWYYVLQMLLVTTPLAIIAMALVGVLVLIFQEQWRSQVPQVYVCFWLWWPLLMVCTMAPSIYDGTRHLLFIMPAVAILAGRGATFIVERAPLRWRARFVFGVSALLFLESEIWDLHPYQYVFYNRLVGGVSAVAGRPNGMSSVYCDSSQTGSVSPARSPNTSHCATYETDYWVTSYKEAAEWVVADAQSEKSTVSVIVSANHLSVDSFAYYCPANFVVFKAFEAYDSADPHNHLPADVDYFVSTTRHGLDTLYPDEPVAKRIGRAGATFTIIKKNKSKLKAAKHACLLPTLMASIRQLAESAEPSARPAILAKVNSIQVHLHYQPRETAVDWFLVQMEAAYGIAESERADMRLSECAKTQPQQPAADGIKAGLQEVKDGMLVLSGAREQAMFRHDNPWRKAQCCARAFEGSATPGGAAAAAAVVFE
jgi:hypothetical protein